MSGDNPHPIRWSADRVWNRPCKPVFGNYLIVQIDAGGIQTSLFGFVPRSSTLIRRYVCLCQNPYRPPNGSQDCRDILNAVPKRNPMIVPTAPVRKITSACDIWTDQTCIRNSNRLWVSRWGCESLSQLRRRGPAYPQPGKVPHFLFGPFSFVNNDSQCCEQALGGSIISAPSTSLSVTRLKQSVAHPKPGRTSEPRPGATALTCEGPQMNPNRLIGALGQPGITRADRGNILDLATSMGSGPSITPKEKGKE